ncbi:sterol desaturase family protein [Lacibacter sp.]|uniref:sterol desaturase family protein n=1 Tax=Lacibacter sp. TaxID=1915409 RepID=UPI002B4AF296|nr:sterol desaturase family protein [Lacibacter sp.]HLP38368.1 sterol desaturase family protein [Lacibacter sp.]
MIRWMLFIPCAAFLCILYFHYLDFIFRGKANVYRINTSAALTATKKEYRNTISNLAVFALTGLLLGFFIDGGYTKVYSQTPAQLSSIIYLPASFLLALLVHDVYFYVTHRLLHLRFWFKQVHRVHHQSHTTNPWSAFSFHFAECIIQIGIVPLLAFLFPLHEIVLMLFVFFMMFITVYGHSGYELRPNKHQLFNIFNTSLHHSQHHQYVHYNFGIYLNIWDRLFASNHPGYHHSFKQLRSVVKFRKEKAKHPSYGK